MRSARRLVTNASAAALCVLFISGCGGENSERMQSKALLNRIAAVDLQAPLVERKHQIEALRALPLNVPALVALRERCAQAHAGLLDAEREQADARQQLDDVNAAGRDPAALSRIAALLTHAGETLRTARTALPGCEQSIRALMHGSR